MASGEDFTTIRISKELKKDLQQLGHKGESYEDIIQRLLNFWRDKHAN